MATVKLFVFEILMLSLLQPSLLRFLEDDEEMVQKTPHKFRLHKEKTGFASTEYERRKMKIIGSLGVVLPVDYMKMEAKDSDKVDRFDKCMQDEMRGKFGYGKYHFTEYKFCKGWFKKKFPDEVELQTINYKYLVDTNELDSDEMFKLEQTMNGMHLLDSEEKDSNEVIRQKVEIMNMKRLEREKQEKLQKQKDIKVTTDANIDSFMEHIMDGDVKAKTTTKMPIEADSDENENQKYDELYEDYLELQEN